MLRSIRCFESRSIGSSTCCSGSLTGNWKEFSTYSGWWLTYPSEKYEKSVGIIIPNVWKNKCSKPPTSISAIGSASLNPLQSCHSGIVRSNQAISVATPPDFVLRPSQRAFLRGKSSTPEVDLTSI